MFIICQSDVNNPWQKIKIRWNQKIIEGDGSPAMLISVILTFVALMAIFLIIYQRDVLFINRITKAWNNFEILLSIFK